MDEPPRCANTLTALTTTQSDREIAAMADRECAWCGEAFQATRPNKRYCCASCGKKANRRLYYLRHGNRERGPFECAFCGSEYTTTRSLGEGEKYCSRECAYEHKRATPWSPVKFQQCTECERKFAAKRERAHCSDECRKECSRRRAREKYAAGQDRQEMQCHECGGAYIPSHGGQTVFCSTKCAKRNQGRRRRSKERARLRCLKAEVVDPYAVFARDGWKCQMCGKPTPRERRGTRYSNAPEMDHRTPLSVGGEHSYANTQCACRACNREKSNRSSVGQLPLIA